MSNVNIKRVIENIPTRAATNVYTPIVEVVVNAIQAIEAKQEPNGQVSIQVVRQPQAHLDDSLPEVQSFVVRDNGIGFTAENRQSFDTLYSDLKSHDGGKGFGRFTCLKYFDDLLVDSVYHNGAGYEACAFAMGKGNEIIVNAQVSPTTATQTQTTVTLQYLKSGKTIDKKLKTIARHLVEKLLPYFIAEDYHCPEITLSETDGVGTIRLNDFVRNELAGEIKEIAVPNATFGLPSVKGPEEFRVRVFKFFFPKSQKSRISLVAHKREVSGSAIHKYVPEFVDDFYEKAADGADNPERNYIIKAYVFSPYLDANVSLERGGFEFQMENDLVHGIAQVAIETPAAELAKAAVGLEVTGRQEKKRERCQAYVDEQAPWHKHLLAKIDLRDMPYNPSNADIESRLQQEKYAQEQQIQREVSHLLAAGSITQQAQEVQTVVSQIAENSKNDLIHYIAMRRHVLELFGKSLECDTDGKYASEGMVHDIIFPRRADSETTPLAGHNLWIIDERLNFTNYVSSDLELAGKNTDRPDLLAYDKRILFRGDNEASNPVTIFEFKKPQRDDFVNPASPEDPVQQIVRYVNAIRDGKFRTPEGRKMLVSDSTPFYGYVICDLTPKVEQWLRREKNFKPMPDNLGWFQWMENNNLYVEVLSWDKVLKDAQMRNRIFFHKLGI